jgi:hypothetical protein
VEQESAISDALLRQLIAVGQVDILVGLPTLNNADTIGDIVRAVNECFTRDFPRLRTVLINSDGGSTDGTPELIRETTISDADTVLTSHALRTLHRVVAPYHGLPGKHSALRTIFAAADLSQASVLVVLDPAGPAIRPERITELVAPIASAAVEFLAPRYRRHPRDGLLVTQLARPLVRAVYGIELDEPLGPEFACSGRFASHCVEQEIWSRDVARFAIDVWLRTEAAANGYAMGQIWRPLTTAPGPRAPRLRDAVQQVMLALVESLASHQSYWNVQEGVRPLPSWGEDPSDIPEAAPWDYDQLAHQARHDLQQLEPLLQSVLDGATFAAVRESLSAAPIRLDDDQWVSIVYTFVGASQRTTAVEHVAGLFVPLYFWRATSFMAATEGDAPAMVQQRLDALCATFQRLKPTLVDHWKGHDVRST